MVVLGKNDAVHGAFWDWKHLLVEMKFRPTHVNELVLQNISEIGNIDASVIGAWGILVSTSGAYHNTIWRVEWPVEISNQIVSKSNRKGIITNSDLEMATLLLQWLVLEKLAVTLHCSAMMRCDNTPTCSWATCMSPKSKTAARLVQALALRQCICQVAPMLTLHDSGEMSDIADIPSRFFRWGHCWNCPDEK